MNDQFFHLPVDEWVEWLQQVMQPATLKQLGVIIGLGAVAWALVRLLRTMLMKGTSDRQQSGQTPEPDVRPHEESLFLGAKDYDGVLFPIIWLGFTTLASHIMQVSVRSSLFRIALPVILALVVIRTIVKIVYRLWGERRWVKALEQTVSWIVWACVVLWASGLLPDSLQLLDDVKIKLGSINTTLLNLLAGIVFVVGSLLVALWVSSLIEARLLRNATGSGLSLRKIVSNGIRGFLLFLAVLTGLKVVNIDLTAFSVFGGALGVGIGLGLQKLAANYVSGFVVLLERSVRIGDMIKVDNFEGRVTDISARFTRLRSTSGVESILPNDMLVNLRVENSSLIDPRVWQWLAVTVGYDSDVELVQRLLVDAAMQQPRVQRDPPPAANLYAFGDNGLEFRLGFWIADPENSTMALRSAINLQILRSLRDNGIEIPYPQRVLRTLDKQPDATVDSEKETGVLPAQRST